MCNFSKDRQFFLQAVTSGANGRVELLLHTVRRLEDKPFVWSDEEIWPKGTTITNYNYNINSKITIIDFFCISLEKIPDDFSRHIRRSLEYIYNQRQLLSWFVLEFVVDENADLQGLWGPKSVYAFLDEKGHAQIALTCAERESTEWSQKLERTLSNFYLILKSEKNSQE